MKLMAKENGEKKYVPDVFVEAFRRDGYEVVGEKSVKRFNCPHCDKSYASEATLRKHIEDKHPDKAVQSADE